MPKTVKGRQLYKIVSANRWRTDATVVESSVLSETFQHRTTTDSH